MLYHVTGHAVLHDFRGAAVSPADYWFAARHGFQVYETESFAATRQSEDFRGGIAGRKFFVRNSAQEMYVTADTAFARGAFQPVTIITRTNHYQLQFRPAHQQAWHGGDECIHAFISFGSEPAAHGEHDAALGKIFR